MLAEVKLIYALLVFNLCLSLVWQLPNTTLAFSNTLNTGTQVTAGVADRQNPTPPILIFPGNGAFININQPEFSWGGSSDDVAVSFYRLWLDGNILLVGLEPAANIAGIFSFVPPTGLSDGQHTWQVGAIDTSGNIGLSAIWSFTVDTLAPTFLIGQIGELLVDLQAPSDLSLVEPYIVTTNQPTLSGSGEPGSLIKLSIVTNAGQISNLTFEVESNGFWSIKLPKLPENTLLGLTFIIQDQAGNISIISKLPLIIKPDTRSQLPTMAGLIGLLPSFISPRKINPPAGLGNIAIALWLITTIVIGLIYLSRRLGYLPNLQRMRDFFWILGWWPDNQEHGLVYSASTRKAIGLAKLNLYRVEGEATILKDQSLLANRHGQYRLPKLEAGKLKLSGQHPSCLFPALEPRTENETWQTYYQGEVFTLIEKMPLPVIGLPMSVEDNKLITQNNSWPLQLASWSGRTGWLLNLPISLVLTILYPSLFNQLCFVMCLGVLLLHRRNLPS